MNFCLAVFVRDLLCSADRAHLILAFLFLSFAIAQWCLIIHCRVVHAGGLECGGLWFIEFVETSWPSGYHSRSMIYGWLGALVHYHQPPLPHHVNSSSWSCPCWGTRRWRIMIHWIFWHQLAKRVSLKVYDIWLIGRISLLSLTSSALSMLISMVDYAMF